MSAAATISLNALPHMIPNTTNKTIILNNNMDGAVDDAKSPSSPSVSFQHYDSDDIVDQGDNSSGGEEEEEDRRRPHHHHPTPALVEAEEERPSMLSDRPSMLSEPTFVDRPSMIGGGGSEDSRDMVMVMMDEDDSSSHDGTSNSSSMASANNTTHHKVPHKRGKRKKYQKYTPEDRIAIGKYCFEHGPAAARKAFQDRYPEMSESVTRGFRDKYKQMIGESAVYEFEQKRQKELQNSYTPPPRGRPRKYKFVEEPSVTSSISQRSSPPLQQKQQQQRGEGPVSMIKHDYHRYPAHYNGSSRLPASDHARSYSMAEKGRRPTFLENNEPQPTRETKITREDQLKIGRYCSLHGVMKALQEFHKEYPGISEAIIFDFHKQYQRHKQEQDHLRQNNNNNKKFHNQGGYHSPPPSAAALEYPGSQPQVFVLESDQMPPTPTPTTTSSSNNNKPVNYGSMSPSDDGHPSPQRKSSPSPVVSPRSIEDEDTQQARRHSPYSRSPPPPQALTTRGESRSPPYRSKHYERGGEIRYSILPPPPSRETKDDLPSPPQRHIRRRSRSPPPSMQQHSPRMHHHSMSPRNIRHSPNSTTATSSQSSANAPPIIHYPRPRPHSPTNSPPHHPQAFKGHHHHLHRSISENNGNRHLRDYDVIPPRVNGFTGSVEYPYDRKEFNPKSMNNQSGGRSKRFKYQKYTPEDRYNIGKLCNDIGLGATVKVYREQFPRLNESVVRTFRNKYRELLEKGGGVPATEAIERKPSRRSISTLIEGEVVSQLKQFHSSQIELSENFVIAVAENLIATKHQKEAENIKGIVTKEWANSLLWKHKLLDKPSGNVQGVCCERCKTILVCPKCPP